MTTTTTSFLMDCPQCGLMIPKGGPCAECHWSENAPAANDSGQDSGQYSDQDIVRAYAARRRVHLRNYAIFMVLAMTAGLVSLITAYMWIKVIYLGDIVAFFLIGFLTVASGILGVTAGCAKRLFPVDLNCPACNIRLDELGTNGGHCPNCSARLQ